MAIGVPAGTGRHATCRHSEIKCRSKEDHRSDRLFGAARAFGKTEVAVMKRVLGPVAENLTSMGGVWPPFGR